jgi:hypothetical protein
MKLLLSTICLSLLFAFSAPLVAVAQSAAPSQSSGSTVEIPNPIACADVNCLVTQVIRYILGVIAIIATIMFIWGGVMMLTSAGNAERVKRAKETLAWASIGIVVIILSWAIIRFVLQGLVGTTK